MAIKIRVMTKFPATVNGENGVAVRRASGTYTFYSRFRDWAPAISTTDLSKQEVPVFQRGAATDGSNDVYLTVPYLQLAAKATSGTSATPLTLGTGSRIFATQSSLAFLIGARIRASHAAAPANYMEGIVTDYTGGALTVLIDRTAGAGTYSDWNLNFVGQPGAGDLLSTLNLADVVSKIAAMDNLSVHGADIASAATLNLDTATGNFVRVTGSIGITAMTLTDGRQRTVYFTGSPLITASASLVLQNGAATLQTEAGAIAVLVADGTTVRLADYVPASQTAARALIGLPNIFRPEDYGGGPAVADNAPAFQALATAVRAAGGGVVNLRPGATYTVYPTDPAAGTYTLFDFSNTNGVVFNANGAKITTPISFTTPGKVILIGLSFNNSFNYTVNGLWMDQSVQKTIAPNADYGTLAIDNFNTVQNGFVNGLKMTGSGLFGFRCVRTSVLTPPNRARGFVLINFDIDNVYYPLSFQKNGDQVVGRNIKTTKAKRCYFPYNVSQHDFDISSDADGAFQDAIISNNYDSTEGVYDNTTADIRLRYKCWPPAGATPPNSYVCTTFQSGATEGKGYIRNVQIEVDINQQNSGSPIPILKCLNQTTTAQNRTLDNVTLTGKLFCTATAAGNFLELFIDKNWAGDFVENFKVENLVVENSGSILTLAVDGRGIVGPFTLKNINNPWGGAYLAYSGLNMTAAAKYLDYSKVFLPTEIGSVRSSVAPATAWAFDTSGQVLIPLAINATYDIVAADGLVSVVDNGGNAAGMFFAAYASTLLVSDIAGNLGTVSGTAGKLNFFYNAGTSMRRFENKTALALSLLITTIRTR